MHEVNRARALVLAHVLYQDRDWSHVDLSTCRVLVCALGSRRDLLGVWSEKLKADRAGRQNAFERGREGGLHWLSDVREVRSDLSVVR